MKVAISILDYSPHNLNQVKNAGFFYFLLLYCFTWILICEGMNDKISNSDSSILCISISVCRGNYGIFFVRYYQLEIVILLYLRTFFTSLPLYLRLDQSRKISECFFNINPNLSGSGLRGIINSVVLFLNSKLVLT